MKKIRIGIIREGKVQTDARVPLIPEQCMLLKEKYPFIDINVQSSTLRCYADLEYKSQGVEIIEDMEECDILLGVKEVPVEQLVANKTYLFFSHTIKEQPYNRKLLQAVVEKHIRLIDYECLTDEKGLRVIAFGRWAGIVGAHNGLFAWGKKTGLLQLQRVGEFKDFESLKLKYQGISVPPVRIAITGDGRVANGAVEVMELLKIRKVSPEEYLTHDFDEPVFVQLSPKYLYINRYGKEFDLKHFFDSPQEYDCHFKEYYRKTDLMINAIYWDPDAPPFFTKEEMDLPEFKIKTIADIACDINGSIPATHRVTTIDDPVFGYDPVAEKETEPYQLDTIDIMAVDNLPNELPRDASQSFGEQLIEHVMEELLYEKGDMIQRATIAENGHLGQYYQYLSDYLEGR